MRHPRHALAPDRCTTYRPAPHPPRRVLGIWAHPDDEAYLAAGLMDRVVRAGGSATIVALTDGEGGFDAADARSDEQRRVLRRRELRSAMATIGVTEVHLLGLPDGGVASTPAHGLVDTLAVLVDQAQPDVITTFGPDGITGHDDHVACGRLATRAWLAAGCPGELWYAAKTIGWLDEWRELHDRFGMWMTEEPTGVDDTEVELVVDLDDDELDRKRTVLRAHGSQTAAVASAIGEAPYRRWIRQEAFRRPTAAELAEVAVDAAFDGDRSSAAHRSIGLDGRVPELVGAVTS
jgi:LmbE family N-acetylglucosaminyl deacetylase